MDNQGNDDTLITLTADIVAAHVSNNSVAVNDLPQLIQNVHGALAVLTGSGAAVEAKPEPKVPIRSSVKPDYIVCLEDGKKMKMQVYGDLWFQFHLEKTGALLRLQTKAIQGRRKIVRR